MKKPERPFFALIGGSKISSKIGVLSSLSEKVDEIFIGGGMAYTFLKALGHPIGNSIYEKEFEETAMSFLKKCKENKIEVHLPQDLIVADRFDNNTTMKKTILPKRGSLKVMKGWISDLRQSQTGLTVLKSVKHYFGMAL